MLADVLDGYVTLAQARAVYGVVLDESAHVDEEETAALRTRLREDRP